MLSLSFPPSDAVIPLLFFSFLLFFFLTLKSYLTSPIRLFTLSTTNFDFSGENHHVLSDRIRACTCIYLCMCICVCVCIFAHTCICPCVYKCVCIRVCVCVCVCVERESYNKYGTLINEWKKGTNYKLRRSADTTDTR